MLFLIGSRGCEFIQIELPVDCGVLLAHGVVSEMSGRVAHDPADGRFPDFLGKAVKFHCLIDRPAQAAAIEVVEKEAVSGSLIVGELVDGVVQPTGIVGDGKRAIAGADHLWKSTGFVGRGHENKI